MVSSLSCLPKVPNGVGTWKKRLAAALSPYEPDPKYTVLRYSMRIFSFENFSLRRSASSISLILRLTSRFDVRMRFFTSCWVIVEPPCSIFPDVMLVRNARNTPPRSMPSLVQNERSSVAITASWTILGTSASDVIGSRASRPNSGPICVPSAQ